MRGKFSFAVSIAVLYLVLFPSRAVALSDNIGGCYYIISTANANYVSVDPNANPTVLRARVESSSGLREKFYAVRRSTLGLGPGFTLQSYANYRFARPTHSTDSAISWMVTATTPGYPSYITIANLFQTEKSPNSSGTVSSSGIYARGNSKWISAEFGYTGSRYAMLRARNTFVGPWERFTLAKKGGSC